LKIKEKEENEDKFRKNALKRIRNRSAETKEKLKYEHENNLQHQIEKEYAKNINNEQRVNKIDNNNNDNQTKVIDTINETNKNNLSPSKKNKNNKTSKNVPKWALTQNQLENNIEDEVDDLLEFTNNLDFEDFINDIEVKAALKVVKERVNDIQKKEREKQKQDKIERLRMKDNDARVKDMNIDDVIEKSELRSLYSEGQKSIAESRIEERIDELKSNIDKKEKREFDTSSRVGDNVGATEYEKLAKNIADKVLQSNPNLKEKHSNKSIRTLLEKEAIKELKRNEVNIVIHKDKDIEKGQRFSKNGLNQPYQ